MAKKTLLICGATGFIGRNMAEYFAKQGKYHVIGVYHRRPPYDFPNLHWRKADLREPKQIDDCLKGVDLLIQAAATTSGSKDIVNTPQIHITDNAVMNSYLLRAVFEQGLEHFLFFSCAILLKPSDTALDEHAFDGTIHPNYFGAGWTKAYIEKMCEFFSRQGRTRHTVIRHSNVYGPYDKYDLDRSHVFGATITKALTTEEDKPLVVWGSGEEARDLLHVDDLVDFVDRALDRQTTDFNLINCGYGEAITIKDLVHKIVQHSGRNLTIEHDLSKPSIKASLFLDCKKAKEELDWQPRISIDAGIKRTLDWWREHRPLENHK
ncbi:NAD-dependent epimerase/dehydratase family protein [Magnetococcales bacterium HHB-1]